MIPGLGKCPGEGIGYPFQDSYLDNPHGQGHLAGYNPWRHKELDMTEWLSTCQFKLDKIHDDIRANCHPHGSIFGIPTFSKNQCFFNLNLFILVRG